VKKILLADCCKPKKGRALPELEAEAFVRIRPSDTLFLNTNLIMKRLTVQRRFSTHL